MNFGFSDEQEMLRESATRFLDAECPPSLVRKMIDNETAHSDDLWRKLAALGWLGVLVPKKLGGMGGTLLDAAVLLEETGRALLPGAFFSTVVFGGVVVSLAGSPQQKKHYLSRIADGSLTMTVAFLEASLRYDAEGVTLAAKPRRGDWMLSGEKLFVLDAAVADWIIVAARTSRTGVTLFAIERGSPGLRVVPIRTVDGTRRQASVVLDRVVVPAKQVLGRVGGGGRALERAIAVATAAIAVETVGVAQQALDRSVAYATERTQFGKAIGSFQAVKHKCVDMLVAVENARSLAYYAAWAVERSTREAAKAVAMAKAYASDMGKAVTGDAIQVHGGIGFTWEHDIHLYYRRALANEATFGPAPLHREAVARQLAL